MNKIVIDHIPTPRKAEDCFSTELFLYDFYSSMPDKLSSEQFKTLDRLCKKIDVVRKIFISYTNDLSKAKSNTLVTPQYNIVLISILLYYAEEVKDFKFLNSAMKLFDLTQNYIDQEVKVSIEKRYIDLLNKLDIQL